MLIKSKPGSSQKFVKDIVFYEGLPKGICKVSYPQLRAIGGIGLFPGLKSDTLVTQFPRYDRWKGLDKPV